MKKIYPLLFFTSVYLISQAQNVGVGTNNPAQKLEVAGWIELGNETEGSSGTAGSIRYNTAGKIQFHNGTAWVDILSANNNGDYINNQTAAAQTAGYWISGAGSVGSTRFRELPANGVNYIALQSPNSMSSDLTFTLPNGYGSSNQVLIGDGAGTFSWGTVSTLIGTDADANDGLSVTYPDVDLNVNNGLSLGSDNVQLGGNLIKATTLTQDNFALTIANNNAQNTTINLSSTGDFDVQDNGTSALFVRDDANVGISTNAPAAKLHVAGGSVLVGTAGNTGTTRTLSIINNGQSQINFGSYPGAWNPAFAIQNNDNSRFMWMSPMDVASGANARILAAGTGLDIYTNGAAASAGTYSTTFATDGSVGIGTTSPSTKLEVVTSGTNEVRFSSTSGFGAAQLSFVSDKGSASEWRPGYIVSADAGSFTGRLDFYTNGTGSGNKFGTVNTMTVTNGSVGIGNTAPSARLDVTGGRVEFQATTDANGNTNTGVLEIANALRLDGNEIITNTGATLSLQADNGGDLSVDAGTLYVEASGDNVGVYTTNPIRRFHVVDDVTGNLAAIICDNPTDDTGVRSDLDLWGFIGFSNVRWWRMYAADGYYTSHTKYKTDLSYLTNEDYMARLQDLRNIQSIRFRWKKQLEEQARGLAGDNREHEKGEAPGTYPPYEVPLNLGFAVESLPKELLDETGENYSSSGMFGLLIAAIKALDLRVTALSKEKEAIAPTHTAPVFEGGSVKMNSNEMWVLFPENFSDQLTADNLPVITVTSSHPAVSLSITEKSEKGFKVVANGLESIGELVFDWIAMVKM